MPNSIVTSCANCSSKRLQLILALLGLLLPTQELAQNVAARNQVIYLLRGQPTLGKDLLQTSEFLLHVPTITAAQLVDNLDVVLRIPVLDALGRLHDLLRQLAEALVRHVFRDNRVQGRDGAGLVIGKAAGLAVGAGLVVQEGDEVGLGAAALVGDGFLGALGEEFDRRVSGDTLLLGNSLGVLSFGVNLGDDDVWVAGEVVGKIFPNRG
jgi:hypothetical protein